MTTYLFSYRVPKRPPGETLAALDDDARAARLAAWNSWFDMLGGHVVDRGEPVGDAREIGTCGPETRVGGYTVVTAENFDDAIELARGCPGLEFGGGVEVGEIVELPGVTTAARERATTA